MEAGREGGREREKEREVDKDIPDVAGRRDGRPAGPPGEGVERRGPPGAQDGYSGAWEGRE